MRLIVNAVMLSPGRVRQAAVAHGGPRAPVAVAPVQRSHPPASPTIKIDASLTAFIKKMGFEPTAANAVT
ncbi:hypothetical protein [Rhizobium beringeri]|uniref:hypothetical protein n=1 Tax=Rhizobium beringeri TaxID=3019934 RepID=UPI003B5C641B